MKRLLGKWHIVGFGLVVVVLLINSAVAYRNIRRLHSDAFWVAHTHEVLESLDDLTSAVRDAEGGRRRLLVAGKQDLVKPYADELAALDSQLERFVELTTDNDHQQSHIPRLQRLVRAKLDELTRTIAARKGPAFETARQAVVADPRKNRMVEIREIVARMQQEEQELLREREKTNDRAYYSALVTNALAALIGLAAVCWFAWILHRHMGELYARLEMHRKLDRLQVELQETNSRLERANARMSRDLEAAAMIQRTFLPLAVPRIPGTEVAWCYRPCNELAGDALNIIPLGGGKVGLYVLDVSGHGVSSALLSVTLSRLLSPPSEPSSILTGNPLLLESPDVTPPAEVADRLNRLFPYDTTTEQFATLMYGVLDVSTGDFRHVSAGHRGPLHLPAEGPPVILESPGYPIGLADEPYDETCLRLQAGDRLYLYSDGLPDAMNPDGERFGDGRLLQAIVRRKSEPLAEGIAALMAEIAGWQGDGTAQDDVSVLAVELVAVPKPAGPAFAPNGALSVIGRANGKNNGKNNGKKGTGAGTGAVIDKAESAG
jgi:serine phosphatase RsbU (regulator of sigma subunit)/CHASE3 domain sensor protein